MKRPVLMIIVILMFVASSFSQNAGIRIMETGTFHGDEISAETGEVWLGLFRQGDAFSLLPTVITVSTVNDPIVDDADQATGKEVSVHGYETPLFLIRGNGFGQARAVPTVFVGDETIYRSFDRTFEFAGQSYRLNVESEKRSQENSENIDETSQLILTAGKHKQILYRMKHCDDCSWQINWAGDLDGDHKLDFYLYLNDHYNVVNMRLFLSSHAEKGDLVKEAAVFRLVGC